MSALTLAQASTIVDTALVKARELKLKPLTVAVLDAGGLLKALKREDGTSLLRPDMAQAKAWGCLGYGIGARGLVRTATERPQFFASLVELAGGRMLPVAGGVLIRDSDGAVIGAAGITGDTSDNDEICAVAGIRAAGLVADTGEAT